MSGDAGATGWAWTIRESPPREDSCRFCGRSKIELEYSEQLGAWCCLASYEKRTSREMKEARSSLTGQLSKVPEVSKVSLEDRDVSMEAPPGGGPGRAPLGSGAVDQTAARAKALGIDAPLGERFEFELFGRRESAQLHPTRKGFWIYRSPSGEFGLGEIRGLLAYGSKRHLSPVEQARWKERLDWEAGLLDREPLDLGAPEDATLAAQKVARGIGLFLGLRDERWPVGEPFVFARDFLKAYCDVTDDGARRAMRELESLGLIVRVGRSGRALRWRLGHPSLRDSHLERGERS
jgi:hypothetical protein